VDPTESLPAAFFLPTGPDTFTATAAAQGPWDPGAMHGGPPAALVATLLSRQATQLSPTLRLARLSLDFLGALPLGELTAAVTVLRPGKRVALLEATLSGGDRVALVGRAWFINAAESKGESPARLAEPGGSVEAPPLAPPPPLPPPVEGVRFFSAEHSFGYGHANEWRFTSGGFDEQGPGAVWSRPRVPLIAGEPLNGLQRLMILADAANGISGTLDWNDWIFIPPGLTVTMLREPVGEWVHMAARTTLGDDGIALCHGHLSDEQGPVALVSQPVLVGRR
jgi:acyl-coenzyme A thioesterase PaaI-like protein